MTGRKQFLTGLWISALATAALTAILFAAAQAAGLPFAPFDVFDGLTRILPGPVVTFGIDLMIDTMIVLRIDVADTAKLAEQIMAVLMFVGIGTVIGAGYLAVVNPLRPSDTSPLQGGGKIGGEGTGLIAGAILGVGLVIVNLLISQSALSVVLRGTWLLVTGLAWGAALGRIGARLARPAPQPASAETGNELLSAYQLDRRRFLIRVGTVTAAITVIGAGVGLGLQASGRGRRLATNTSLPDWLPNADDPVIPAPGTRPEYTPLADHYRVFIRTEPTVIDGAAWRLPITGLVDNPMELTLDEIRARWPPRDQFVTLSCISGRIGTTLIGTTLWTGASLQLILDDLGVQPDAKYVFIESGDGFYETVNLDLIRGDERIMLAYDWNREPLPVEHGFPLRIYIPDRYGMKQPKWITSIQVVSDFREGYWVERKWDIHARVKTVSVIDTVAADSVYNEAGRLYVPIGGIANSGAKGISKVEVRVDGGQWVEALRRMPLSETAWTIWRYDWPFEAGEHTFEVRCSEGDGTPQIETYSDARPSGSTGIHRVEAEL